MSARPFPWAEAMGFAFAVLKLSPAAFWAMTPRELAAAIRHGRADRGLALHADALSALMHAFPDTTPQPRT